MIVTVSSADKAIDWGATGEDRIFQNVLNIIRTRLFEVPFMREFGINPDFVDSTVQNIKAELRSHVIDVINTYEDRVTVLDVRISAINSNGDYVIDVDLEV